MDERFYHPAGIPRIDILTKNREFRGSLEPLEAAAVIGADGPARHKVLSQLREEEYWLRCPCGRVLHPFRKLSTVSLRIPEEEGAPLPGFGCSLCERTPRGIETGDLGKVGRPKNGREGLILGSREWEEATDAGGQIRQSKRGTRELYGSMRARLRVYLEAAGWHALQQPIRSREMWRQVREVLRERVVRLDHGQEIRLSDIVWLPDESSSPGSFAWRVSARWPESSVRPEMWQILMVEEGAVKQGRGGVSVYYDDLAGRRWNFEVPRDHVAWATSTPPYIAFAAGATTTDSLLDWTPSRLVLEGVSGLNLPIPVDSSEERRAIEVLRMLGWRFQRVLFPIRGVWPDFLLPDHRMVLEVNGCRRDGYAERKERTARHIEAAFPDWHLVTWHVNIGEGVDDLVEKLVSFQDQGI